MPNLASARAQRFHAYVERLTTALGHQDRHGPLRAYVTGLCSPGERKSIEPMAARVDPRHVRARHQSMHHFIANAAWDDAAVLRVARETVLAAGRPFARAPPALTRRRAFSRIGVLLSIAAFRHPHPDGLPFGRTLARAGWRCQACGVLRRLDVHHVVKRSQGGSDFDLDQLVALCRWCHDQTDAPLERGRLVVTALGAGQFAFEVVQRAGKEP